MPLFNWTGNPWVDTGLAVAVVRANKRSPEELSLEDFKGVIGDGKWLTHANEHLNSYVCLFANGFLNRSVPAQIVKQREKYIRIIATLLDDLEKSIIEKVDSTNRCECTGIFPSANKALALLTEQFIKEGKLTKGQRLDIGRNAFPLIGSIANDAGALPAASREPQLSAFVLLCAQMASLAAVMLKGKIAFFQYTEPNLIIPHVRSIYSDTVAKLQLIAENKDSSISAIGTGKGSQSLALILLDEFNRLKTTLEVKDLSDHVALNLWLLINSGTSCDCEIIEIPNSTLKFLWQAGTKFPDEIKGFLKKEKHKSILDCIENREDYFSFYPFQKLKPIPGELVNRAKAMLSAQNRVKADDMEVKEVAEFDALKQAQIVTIEDKKKKKEKKNLPKENVKQETQKNIVQLLNDEYKQNKRPEIKDLISQVNESISKPASKELFALYQTKIMGRPLMALSAAEWIAYNLKKRLQDNKKQLELFIQKLGDFKDANKCRPTLRQVLAEFAEEGSLSYEQYTALFPILGNRPIRVDNFGWRYIWFYLNHENLSPNPQQYMEGDCMAIDNQFRQTIKRFSQDVFDWYVEKNGEEKCKKKILDGFRNNKIRDADLQLWFCNLGEIPGKEGYTNEAWDDLCRDETGANRTFELRFQLRLELANLYRKYISAINIKKEDYS